MNCKFGMTSLRKTSQQHPLGAILGDTPLVIELVASSLAVTVIKCICFSLLEETLPAWCYQTLMRLSFVSTEHVGKTIPLLVGSCAGSSKCRRSDRDHRS